MCVGASVLHAITVKAFIEMGHAHVRISVPVNKSQHPIDNLSQESQTTD